VRLFPRTLLDILAAHPDRTAFEDGRRRVSAGEVLALTGRLAAGMRAFGLGPGRSVAFVTALTPEAFAAHLTAYALGCVVVGVRPGWTNRQLADVLGTRVDAVVVDASTATPDLLALARQRVLFLGPGSGCGSGPGCCGPGSGSGSGSGPGSGSGSGVDPSTDLSAFGTEDVRRTVSSRADDLARVNFTSGSSGRPKGCAWTYAALHPAFDPDRWSPDLARLLASFQRCLVFGTWSMPVMLTFAGRSLLLGGTVVIASGDVRSTLGPTIERHAITGAVTPVPALRKLLAGLRASARPTGLADLAALVVTGSPAPPSLLAEAVELLGPVVWQGYGQSESGMISLLTPDDIARTPAAALSSVGRVQPQVEISVRDEHDRPVPPGGTGRILVRSPQMMAGYWGEDAATSDEVMRDGWLDTRDLGRVDADGFLHLTGRARDVILVRSQVRYAAPIEGVLADHPDVAEAYVVGVPDPELGEAIHAFVVPRAGRNPDAAGLAARVGADLGDGHVPAAIRVIAAAPLGPGGKPDKQALRREAVRLAAGSA
jgi:fatty-acyl-CoA synthase